jgi:hypothetical protein
VATLAEVYHRRTFISTAQLHIGKLDFLPATLLARFLRGAFGLEILTVDALDTGLELLSQKRREVGGVTVCNDRL